MVRCTADIFCDFHDVLLLPLASKVTKGRGSNEWGTESPAPCAALSATEVDTSFVFLFDIGRSAIASTGHELCFPSIYT